MFTKLIALVAIASLLMGSAQADPVIVDENGNPLTAQGKSDLNQIEAFCAHSLYVQNPLEFLLAKAGLQPAKDREEIGVATCIRAAAAQDPELSSKMVWGLP